MKNSTSTPSLKSWPRLLVETSDASLKTEKGFLQISVGSQKLALGDTLGREFRLLQCLFSAQNFLSAKYAPVTQTYERLYAAIKLSGDSVNEKLTNAKSADGERVRIVQNALQLLKQGAAGKYLLFITVDDKLRMEIVGAVAA